MKYYNTAKLIERFPDADYYIVFGERSNGKTYSALTYAVNMYAKSGKQTVYLRRYEEDVRRKYMMELYTTHIRNGVFDKVFPDMELPWNGIEIIQSRVYLTRTDWLDGKRILTRDEKPFMYLFSLNTWEHAKGVSYPDVELVIFDEFLSRTGYLWDETTNFANFISTIVRERDNVKVLMLGNTVSPYSPYFQEMGMLHVGDMKPGTIQQYKSSDGLAQYVIEYCINAASGKASDKYFSLFDNERTKMITKGSWETADYPRFPVPFDKVQVRRKFFIVYNGDMVQGSLVCVDRVWCLYFTPWTRPIFEDGELKPQFKNAIVYTDFPYLGKHIWHALTKQMDVFTVQLIRLFRENRVYYANNRTGEMVRAYLIWSDGFSPKK